MVLRSCLVLLPKLTKPIKLQNCHNFSKSMSCVVSQTNQITQFSTSVHRPTEQKHPKEVYYGMLTPQIKAVKIFSLSSSLVGVVGQPFLYNAIVSTGNFPIIVAAYSFIGFFTVVTPFLLHFITRKYVTNLLYDSSTDTYTAKTVNFFCITKETKFKVKDVTVPDVPGMFTTLHAHGKPLFLDARLFENPEHYARLMGYDKPMDFKLYETPPIDKEK